jgi:predicted GNAT family acetyltransferase
VDDQDGSRFVHRGDGAEGELRYRLNGRRLVIVHTEVSTASRGQGIGGRLVRAALDRARANGETIVPWCLFARTWLQEHADEVAGVAVDWSGPPPR